MRNYVFIKNLNAFEVIEEHLNCFTTSSVEVTENRKGRVITFHNSYWANRVRDFVEFQRGIVAFEMVVTPMNEKEKFQAQELVRTLSRINNELAVMCSEFRKRGDFQTV